MVVVGEESDNSSSKQSHAEPGGHLMKRGRAPRFQIAPEALMEFGSYDYFEERPLESPTLGTRRKHVPLQLTPGVSIPELAAFRSSQYAWRKTRDFEGRAHVDEAEGVWPINHLRVSRREGDVEVGELQYEAPAAAWPSNVEQIARRFRLHHYLRVWNSQQCIDLVSRDLEVRFSFEITEDWKNPPNGDVTIDPNSPILTSHAVPLIKYDAHAKRLRFHHLWKDWGDDGNGSIDRSVFDDFIVEAWCFEGRSLEPPVLTKHGLVRLLWKVDLGAGEVHGREIIDAGSGERIAWTFLTRKSSYLDIEEFFVWPTHRRHGFGKVLSSMILELKHDIGLELRAWIPFADAEPENRIGLTATLELLGLYLNPSPHRAAAFVATEARPTQELLEPKIPDRPAAIPSKLDPAVVPWEYSVWFGTNREPLDSTDLSRGFTGNRSDRVHYGTCKVTIPKSHRFGSVGSSWWKRWTRRTDDRLKVAERSGLTRDDFWGQLTTEIASWDTDRRHGVIFIHGYNVDFDEAAIRAAQIGFDLRVEGVTAFFSWPSHGTIYGYAADESTIDASEQYILAFISEFIARSGASHVHIVAHSMGNRGLLRALERLASTTSEESRPLAQIILAAPDVDRDVFLSCASALSEIGQRVTLYASPADRAVAMSEFIHQYPRAGFTPPVTTLKGIDTIEVPMFDILTLGHGYFAEAAPLLHDIYDLMRTNADPSRRQRLMESRNQDTLPYWVMMQ